MFELQLFAVFFLNMKFYLWNFISPNITLTVTLMFHTIWNTLCILQIPCFAHEQNTEMFDFIVLKYVRYIFLCMSIRIKSARRRREDSSSLFASVYIHLCLKKSARTHTTSRFCSRLSNQKSLCFRCHRCDGLWLMSFQHCWFLVFWTLLYVMELQNGKR